MTTKTKAERESGPFIKPTKDFYRYTKKNAGGRYAAKTPEGRFEGVLHSPELFKRRPLKPPMRET